MAAVKRLNTTYTIDTTDVFLTGNLHVLGVYDTTNVTNTNIQDKDIVLNVGENQYGVGGNAAPGQSSIIVDRGLQANVAIRWNEIYDTWELTTTDSGNSATFSNIATSSTSGITAVAGNVILYSDTVGSAGSGLFVVNSGTASDELVTKSKAIVFSIIL